jgi:hypothetical protein
LESFFFEKMSEYVKKEDEFRDAETLKSVPCILQLICSAQAAAARARDLQDQVIKTKQENAGMAKKMQAWPKSLLSLA